MKYKARVMFSMYDFAGTWIAHWSRNFTFEWRPRKGESVGGWHNGKIADIRHEEDGSVVILLSDYDLEEDDDVLSHLSSMYECLACESDWELGIHNHDFPGLDEVVRSLTAEVTTGAP